LDECIDLERIENEGKRGGNYKSATQKVGYVFNFISYLRAPFKT